MHDGIAALVLTPASDAAPPERLPRWNPDYPSILRERPGDRPGADHPERPACFADLNLDRVVDAIVSGREKYDLVPFFHVPLRDARAIRFRQEAALDLEAPDLLEAVRAFAQAMTAIRSCLKRAAEKNGYPYQKKGWLLEAAGLYGESVRWLGERLAQASLRSRAFTAFRDHVAAYAASEPFREREGDVRRVKAELATVRYGLILRGDCVHVRPYDGENDYSAEIGKTFEKFKESDAEDYRANFPESVEMNHIEGQILARVALLFPAVFASLDAFCEKHAAFLDESMATFDREAQFYLAYLDYIEPLRKDGLPFCYPEVAADRKDVFARDIFDLALARKLAKENARTVRNDFRLEGAERILVVSGPNQGGKTTFARTFGQLHYLACLGCPVPGAEARLFLFSGLFTHFEKEEDIETLRGKLQDDLVRMRDILARADAGSIVILNEIFTSTTLRDAVSLSRRVMGKLVALDALAVWVTFIDELASFGPQTVNMASTVVPENPAERTYKVVRKPADGLAYAVAIAEKYRLTLAQLRERRAA